jgi:hypothetical protein
VRQRLPIRQEVMPVLARECGGKVELPARGLDLVV